MSNEIILHIYQINVCCTHLFGIHASCIYRMACSVIGGPVYSGEFKSGTLEFDFVERF